MNPRGCVGETPEVRGTIPGDACLETPRQFPNSRGSRTCNCRRRAYPILHSSRLLAPRGKWMADEEGGRTVRAEATLLRIPLFALAVKGSAALDGFEHRQVRRRAGDRGAVELVVRTERDDETPYPGPLSRRAHMALLSLVTDRGFPFENPIVWTWRELCRRMGLPNSGRRVAELKGAIRASAGLTLLASMAAPGARGAGFTRPVNFRTSRAKGAWEPAQSPMPTGSGWPAGISKVSMRSTQRRSITRSGSGSRRSARSRAGSMSIYCRRFYKREAASRVAYDRLAPGDAGGGRESRRVARGCGGLPRAAGGGAGFGGVIAHARDGV